MSNTNNIRTIAQGIAWRVLSDYVGSVPTYLETITGEVETSDDTATDILVLEPADYSSGILEVMCAGFDGTNAITGIKKVRFKKVGTVTLGTVTDDLATVDDATGASFDIITSSGNIVVQVTGVAATLFKWTIEYRFINVVNEPLL